MLIFGYLFLKLLMMSSWKFLTISEIVRNFQLDIIRSFKDRYPKTDIFEAMDFQEKGTFIGTILTEFLNLIVETTRRQFFKFLVKEIFEKYNFIASSESVIPIKLSFEFLMRGGVIGSRNQKI